MEPAPGGFLQRTLTISYWGANDLVYSVADGKLLVNGAHVLGTPLPASDVSSRNWAPSCASWTTTCS